MSKINSPKVFVDELKKGKHYVFSNAPFLRVKEQGDLEYFEELEIILKPSSPQYDAVVSYEEIIGTPKQFTYGAQEAKKYDAVGIGGTNWELGEYDIINIYIVNDILYVSFHDGEFDEAINTSVLDPHPAIKLVYPLSSVISIKAGSIWT